MFASLGKIAIHSTVLKFAVTGGLNTAVGLGTIFALKWFFQTPDTPANAIGYLVGLLLSLTVNSRWTFKSDKPFLKLAPKYFLTLFAAYLINLLCVTFCIRFLHMNSYLSQACGVIPYAIFTYIVSRRWVFRAESH
jgi:putative flippase GtrA